MYHFKNRFCVICNLSFTPKGPNIITCSPQCYIKNNIIINDNSCWIWKYSRDNTQYSWAYFEGKNIQAHRFSYSAFKSNLSSDPNIDVCHTCDTPACVNPLHLVQASTESNMHDMISKGRDRYFRGADIANAIINDDIALGISTASGTAAEIAKRFKTTIHVVRNVRGGLSWNHATGLPKKKERLQITKSPLRD